MDGKKENERSVEAFIIEVKYHQELKSSKHWINYFSKKKLNLDRLRFLGTLHLREEVLGQRWQPGS